ncbi:MULTISPECIES: TlpA family protein disulfide reductase [unclassified Lacinutrix]
MKKLLIALCALSIVACKEEAKDYVTFSGTITDKNSDSIILRTQTYSKTIKVNEDGTFSDTLKVATGIYNFYDGGESSNVYLQNGYDLNMTLDTKMFDETISYTGIGDKTNNYLAKKALFEETLFPPSLFDFEEEDFTKSISEINEKRATFLEENKDIDPVFYATEKEEVDGFEKKMLGYFAEGKERAKARAEQFASYIGQPSASFDNYENQKGGTTSLADLKGNYVYIDIWATWCGPCLAELPALKIAEKKYEDKKVKFVSISVDEGRGYKDKSFEASKEGWNKMIIEKEMGGIQLFSDKNWKSDFIAAFKVNSIPRFILIDPNGVVVDADAPRPSSPKFDTLFASLSL